MAETLSVLRNGTQFEAGVVIIALLMLTLVFIKAKTRKHENNTLTLSRLPPNETSVRRKRKQDRRSGEKTNKESKPVERREMARRKYKGNIWRQRRMRMQNTKFIESVGLRPETKEACGGRRKRHVNRRQKPRWKREALNASRKERTRRSRRSAEGRRFSSRKCDIVTTEDNGAARQTTRTTRAEDRGGQGPGGHWICMLIIFAAGGVTGLGGDIWPLLWLGVLMGPRWGWEGQMQIRVVLMMGMLQGV
jgi:hypothetical protein